MKVENQENEKRTKGKKVDENSNKCLVLWKHGCGIAISFQADW